MTLLALSRSDVPVALSLPAGLSQGFPSWGWYAAGGGLFVVFVWVAGVALGRRLERKPRNPRSTGEVSGELKHKTLVDRLGEAVLVLRWDTLRCVQANQAACDLFGYTQEEFTRLTIGDWHPPENLEAILHRVEHFLRYEGPHRSQGWFSRKDGSRFFGEVVVQRVEWNGLTSLVGLIRNLTEYRTSLRRYEQLVNNAPLGIFRIEDGSRLVYVNPEQARMFGYASPQDMLQHDPRAQHLSYDAQDAMLFIQNLHQHGEVKDHILAARHRDGTKRFVSVTARLALKEDEQGACIEGFVRDVTEQVEVQKQLQQSQEQLRLILKASSDGINIKERDPRTGRTRLILFNQRFVDMTGRSAEELLDAENIESLMEYENPEAAARAWQECLDRLEPYTGQAAWKRPDGKENYFEWTASPLRVGDHILIVGVDRDITDRHSREQRDEALREELEAEVSRRTGELKHANRTLNRRLRSERALAMASRILLAEADEPSALLHALRHLREGIQACRVYVFENFDDSDGRLCMKQVLEICNTGVSTQIDNRELQALPYDPHFTRWREHLSEKQAISGSVRDFPASEQRILKQQSILSMLVLPIFIRGQWWGFTGFDDTREDRRWDEDEVRMLRTASQMIGAYVARQRDRKILHESEERYRLFSELTSDLTYELVIDPQGHISHHWGSDAIENITGYSWTKLHKIGGGDTLVHPEDRQIIRTRRQKVLSGQNNVSEFRIVDKDGHTHWLREHVHSMTDPATGRVTKLFVATQDITEQKLAEQKILKYQDQLRTLAAQLSTAQERERRRIAEGLHDHVSQNLSVAKLTLQRLQKKVTDPPARESLSMTVEAIKDSIEEIKTLTFELTPTILFQLGFEKAAEWLLERVGARHGLRTKLTTDGTPKPMNDDLRSFLYRALRELLVNIVKHARAESVSVTIAREYSRLILTVEDDGEGFRQTASSTEGSEARGFGLLSIREQLADLDGTIDIEDRADRGTAVRLSVPLNDSGQHENNVTPRTS